MCARAHVYFKAEPSTKRSVKGGRVKGLRFSSSSTLCFVCSTEEGACAAAQPSCHHHGCVCLCTCFFLPLGMRGRNKRATDVHRAVNAVRTVTDAAAILEAEGTPSSRALADVQQHLAR